MWVVKYKLVAAECKTRCGDGENFFGNQRENAVGSKQKADSKLLKANGL